MPLTKPPHPQDPAWDRSGGDRRPDLHRAPYDVGPRATAAAPANPTKSTGVPTPSEPGPQAGWLNARRDQTITARLIDGKSLTGTLLSFDTYALLLRLPDSRAVLVYKHAVAYLAAKDQESAQ